jgi:cytolysin (calcineurin-like family phosphatase)
LFLLTFEARPEPESDDYGQIGGAFVNCWVNVDDLCTAERRAVALIQNYGWHPHRFEAWELVTRTTYTDREPQDDGGPDLREVVEQAFVDGEVCVYHTWPADAPDADDEQRLI